LTSGVEDPLPRVDIERYNVGDPVRRFVTPWPKLISTGRVGPGASFHVNGDAVPRRDAISIQTRVVGSIPLHLSPDDMPVWRLQANRVLFRDGEHSRLRDLGKLNFGRALPEPDIDLGADRLVFRRGRESTRPPSRGFSVRTALNETTSALVRQPPNMIDRPLSRRLGHTSDKPKFPSTPPKKQERKTRWRGPATLR
jgi:hypothetical protein